MVRSGVGFVPWFVPVTILPIFLFIPVIVMDIPTAILGPSP